MTKDSKNDDVFGEMVAIPPDFTVQAEPFPAPISPADIATDRLVTGANDIDRIIKLAGSQH